MFIYIVHLYQYIYHIIFIFITIVCDIYYHSHRMYNI